MSAPKTVIIVGGGPGGLYLAKALGANKLLKVTVVSTLDYWDYSISSPRCITEPGVTKMYTPPMAEICSFLHCDFIHGRVVEVSESGVKMESGDSLPADCVVVAIGGTYAGGAVWKARPDETTADARLKGFEALSAELQVAEEVVVSGAGLVGVEVAGEIKTKYPEKKVRLHGKMNGMSEKLKSKTHAALTQLGVEMVDARATPPAAVDGQVGYQKEGATLFLPCAGFVFNSKACLGDGGLPADVYAPNGQLVTEPTMLLKGAKNVFALGDVVATPKDCFAPPGGFGKCEAQAKVVATNVVNLLTSKNMVAYNWPTNPVYTPCISAFGPTNAVGDMGMPCCSGLEDKIGRKFKAQSFFMEAKIGALFGMGKTWHLGK